ncbi:dUTP diphosphatase [archaeon]|nr:dUTP diphosphatase [archaeon]|tara:strand:- start:207 stop:632 length:426 start_codon:yes stop_codon:yes gene_type:complete
MDIRVKKLEANATMPTFAKEDDAGADLYACEDAILEVGESKKVKTGIAMAIPKGYVGLIWDKSGIASEFGVHTMGGVIDSGYRGEIQIIMKHLGDKPVKIAAGTKVAQILFQKIEAVSFQEVEDLDQTERGIDGFGSTGDL